ncbi:Alpha/Beta hydrolase fold [Russula decolorans]
MPVATVKDSSLRFSYEDSGPLGGLYTTLVMVHGTGFHSGIFGPMIPFAAANRVRLILVNRRDYPGSTPLSDAELAELGSSDLETRAKALAQQGLDIGLFLAWLIREENIPPVVIDRDGKQQGGIALVAWSLAHTPLAGFLAHADSLPTDTLRVLDPCLRAYCIFDAPHGSFGLPTLSKYHPLVEPRYPMEERVPRFYSWVSTYYTHSNLARRTRDPKLLDTSPLRYPAPQCARPATLDVIAPASLEAVSWPGPIQGSEALLHGIPLGVAFEQTRRMLLDKDVGSVLPRCKVVVIWGENTLWEMVGAAWAVEKVYKECEAVGQVGRTLEVVEMPGANHFPHWDEPEAMIRFLSSVV